jgi:hypothetical protein
MAEGGWSSGTWGQSGWGMSVYDRDTSDSAAPSDSTSAAASLTSLVSELGFATDLESDAQSIYSAQVSDEAITAESTEIALVIFGTSVVETTNISDAPVGGLTFFCLEAAAANALDTFVAQATFNGNSIIEAAAGNDAPATNVILPVTVTEFVDCSIEIDSAIGIYTLIFESSSVSDLYAAQVTFGGVVNETCSAEDAVSSLGEFVASVEETANASDTFTGAGNFIVSVNETARASDTFVRRFLWELIDDNQSVSWQLINTNE